jgi:hypothetical protein
MIPKKKKIKIPGIVILLIFVLIVGIGLKVLGFTISYLKEKQPSIATKQIKTARTVKSLIYSPTEVIRPVEKLSDCQVIFQNNLFEPLGGRRLEPQKVEIVATNPQVEPPKPPAEKLNEITLTGIVYIDNEYQALIEDSGRGKSLYLKKGDKIKDYFVESITKDTMVLTNEETRLTKALGSKTYYNNNGKLLASGSQPSTEFASKPTIQSDASEKEDANLSLIERMKARRRKELGQE